MFFVVYFHLKPFALLVFLLMKNIWFCKNTFWTLDNSLSSPVFSRLRYNLGIKLFAWQKLKWNKNFSGNIYRNCLRCKNSKLFYYLPSQPIFWRRFWHDQTINRLQPYFWGLKKCHENFNLFGKMILVLLIKLKKFSDMKVIFHIFCQ